ncbi:MAG: hypothetical protein KAG62_13745 [Caulobacter sp.]|nr:hypothetical protein [Caulobacter sp.]
MSMPLKQVAQIGEYGLLAVLAALAVVLLYRGLASGRLRQLVAGPHGGGPSPARVQALATTLAFAGYYLTEGLGALAQGKTSLPDIRPEVLSVLGASLGVHLGGKLYERPTSPPDDKKTRRKPRRPRRRGNSQP